MTNVHIDVEHVRRFTDSMRIRTIMLENQAEALKSVQVRLAQTWADDQFMVFYDDARRLVSLLEEVVRECEHERKRLNAIADAAEEITYKEGTP